MKKLDVVIALEKVRDAKSEWAKAITDFNADIEMMMHRLLREAAANYMSVEEVARTTGFTTKRVRILMRAAGLDPKRGRSLLAKTAATALAENAALLGIEPSEMDLMSPLAYLPMGSEMRKSLRADAIPAVDYDELPMEGGKVVTGYTSITEAVHDLHLRGGRLRYVCPACGLVGSECVSGNDA